MQFPVAIPRGDGGARDTFHSSPAVCIDSRYEFDQYIELSYTFVRSSSCISFRYFSTIIGGRPFFCTKKNRKFFFHGTQYIQ